jgi:hypothetical protein
MWAVSANEPEWLGVPCSAGILSTSPSQPCDDGAQNRHWAASLGIAAAGAWGQLSRPVSLHDSVSGESHPCTHNSGAAALRLRSCSARDSARSMRLCAASAHGRFDVLDCGRCAAEERCLLGGARHLLALRRPVRPPDAGAFGRAWKLRVFPRWPPTRIAATIRTCRMPCSVFGTWRGCRRHSARFRPPSPSRCRSTGRSSFHAAGPPLRLRSLPTWGCASAGSSPL